MTYATSFSRLTGGAMTLIRFALLIATLALLGACSGNGSTLGSSGTTAQSGAIPQECITDPTLPQCQIPAAGVSVTTDVQQINSDGSDSATITATVLDTSNAALEGITVVFSVTNGGMLSSSTAVTDQNGKAQVMLTANPAYPANQTLIVTATVLGVGSAVVPVDVVGTTLEIVINQTLLLIPTGSTSVSSPISVIARDAGGKTVYNAPIAMATSGAAATLSSYAGVTNTSGTVNTTLTSSTPGFVTFTATGLGTTASIILEVAAEASMPFMITSPTTDPYPITADGSSVPIVVSAVGVTQVTFSTSIGIFAETGTSVAQIAVAADVATATLVAPAGSAGFATVVASDSADSTIFDKLTVAMSPPPSAAAQIILQSDVTSIPVSSATLSYSANLTARVISNDASGGVAIYNVPVSFAMSNTAGGGEYISSSYGTTNLIGEVYTKFTSGINATGDVGVTITATIVGTAISDSITIQIGGEAGSVAIGTPRLIHDLAGNESANYMQMSVQVADGQGHGVGGLPVTLSIWPEYYLTGSYYDIDSSPSTASCVPFVSQIYANEDLDRDTILDNPSAISGVSEDVDQDGELTPANSTAGSVPYSVTTEADGTGPFLLTYLKDYGTWINVAVKATTKVMGTESTAHRRFTLPTIADEEAKCLVMDSPFIDVTHGFAGANIYQIRAPVGGALFTMPASQEIFPTPTTFGSGSYLTATWPLVPDSTPVLDAGGNTIGAAYPGTFTIAAGTPPGKYLVYVGWYRYPWGLLVGDEHVIGPSVAVQVIVY